MAMLDNALPWNPGNTCRETLADCISRRISTARADNGTRKACLRCFLSFKLTSGTVQTKASKSNSSQVAASAAPVRTFVRIRNSASERRLRPFPEAPP
jgi:hypothetical protein